VGTKELDHLLGQYDDKKYRCNEFRDVGQLLVFSRRIAARVKAGTFLLLVQARVPPRWQSMPASPCSLTAPPACPTRRPSVHRLGRGGDGMRKGLVGDRSLVVADWGVAPANCRRLVRGRPLKAASWLAARRRQGGSV
jgi:hypothetical protein